MDETKVQEIVQAAVNAGVATIARQVEEKVTPLLSRLEAVEKSSVRYDAEGKTFKWGTDGQAPAFVKHAGKQSAPLSLSNIWRATMLGKSNPSAFEAYASEELEISRRLQALGYVPESIGGILFPMGEEFIMSRVDEKTGAPIIDPAVDSLRKEIGERLSIRKAVDPGEVAWLMRRFPEMARGFGLTTKDLQLGDDTLGGYLIPATQGDRIIDLLRNRLGVMRAGATEIPLPPSGNLTWLRLTSDPDFVYADPDSTSDASTSNVTLGAVRLIAKAIRGYVTIPNDLLRYSSPSAEMVVRGALAARFAVKEDAQFLEGVGSTIAPRGIINYALSTAETPTAGKVTLHVATTTGMNGDTFEPEDVAKVQALYYMSNDPDMPTAWIKRPLFWAKIRNSRADAAAAGDKKGPFMFPVSRGDMGVQNPPALDGVPVVQTTQASANRSKGGSSVLCYSLFGNFRRMIIGRVGVLELAVSEHVKFLQDKTVIRAVGRNDVALEHESSFVFTDTLVEA